MFAVYSTFLQRAFDQILHDVALQKLKVVFAVDRAGIIGEDGETHQGIFDAAFLNMVPGLTVYSPSSFAELERFLNYAINECGGPVAVRYPRGGEPSLPEDYSPGFGNFDLYGGSNPDTLLVTYGRLFGEACRAVRKARANGAEVSVLKLNRIKPVDPAAIEASLSCRRVLFFEEGIRSGGIGEHFAALLSAAGYRGDTRVYAVNDTFVRQGNAAELLAMLGLDADGMLRRLQEN